MLLDRDAESGDGLRKRETGQGITQFALVLIRVIVIVIVIVVLTVAGSHSGKAFSNVTTSPSP